jgi:hypothetical protein
LRQDKDWSGRQSGTAVSPSITRAQRQSLRLKYDAAYTVYRSCVEAISKASIDGAAPSPGLLQKEANAVRELTESRADLLSAMRNDP